MTWHTKIYLSYQKDDNDQQVLKIWLMIHNLVYIVNLSYKISKQCQWMPSIEWVEQKDYMD